MLQLLRGGLTSYFATGLLGLLIASFALWGIGGDILTGTRNSVARIGDEKLPLNDYAREFQSRFDEIQQRSGGKVTREMVIDQGMARKWVVDLVQRRTFAHVAHALDLRVTDDQLRKYIMQIEAFQDTLGQFSKSKFASIARYQGHTPGEFEEILRRDLERQSLLTSIVSGISVPNAVEKNLIKYLLEERTADIVTIPAASIKDIPEPDEASLKKYYQDNFSRYMAPEYRDLRFITLSSADFINKVTVTPKEIDQAMDSSTETAAKDEKRDFEQILFDSKKNADKAYADLEKGRSFADLIIASGSTPDDAAGSVTSPKDASDSYGEQAAKAVYATKEGKYTAPLETDFGWRIFHITKITAAAGNTGDSRAKTEARLKKEKAIDLLYDESEKINDELAAGGGLSDIAEKLSLDLKTAKGVDKTGYNSKGDLVAGIPADPAFLAKAFEISEDDEPDLDEMDNGNYFLVVLDQVTPPAVRPFADVRASVLDIWKADKRKTMASEKANEILAKAQDGADLKELSAQTADTSFTSVTLARNDQTGKVAKPIKDAIFSLDTGSAKIMPAADGNGFVVIKMLSRKLSDGSMPEAQTARIKDLLKQEYQQRFLNSYWSYLETSLPVIINQAGVKAVHDQLASREQ